MKVSKIYSLIKYFVTVNGINKILYEEEKDAMGNVSLRSIQDHSLLIDFFEILVNYYIKNKIPIDGYNSTSAIEVYKINIILKSVDIEIKKAVDLYNFLDYIFVEFKNILKRLPIESDGNMLFLLRNAHIILFLNNARFFPIDLSEQFIKKFKIHSKNIKIFNLCGSIVIDTKEVCNIYKPEELNSLNDIFLPEKKKYIDEPYKVKNGISLKTTGGLQMLMRIILEFTTTAKSPLIAFGKKKSETLMKRITTIIKKQSIHQ